MDWVMKIDPATAQLFTDNGEYLKTLRCPLAAEWKSLIPIGAAARFCQSCHRPVHDTAAMTDEDLKALLQVSPDACLSVSAAQLNCTVIPASQSAAFRDRSP